MADSAPAHSLDTAAVDAIERVSGTFPGNRRVHARGTCFEATFVPTGEAVALTTAAHLQTTPVLATVRFSNSNTNPGVHDGVRAGRGLAVRFHLANGAFTDLVSVNIPVFFAATPRMFLDLLAALEKDPVTGVPDPAKVAAYVAANPSTGLGLTAAQTMPIPASYATARYWAIHAFTWVNGRGERRNVRYRWEPDAGPQELSEQEATRRGPEYLTDELPARLPAGFTLRVQLGEDGDPTNDPTLPWPEDRPEIVVGHLRVTAPVTDQAHWAGQVFDPTRLTRGIELSDDPVLAFRSEAYAVSYDRRTSQR